jgi:hypothetical protein
MKKIDCIIRTSFKGSISDLIRVRENMSLWNRANRYEIDDEVTFGELEDEFKDRGFFDAGICAKGVFTEKEIKKIVAWNTNLLIYNAYTGKEYFPN